MFLIGTIPGDFRPAVLVGGRQWDIFCLGGLPALSGLVSILNGHRSSGKASAD